MIDYHFKSTGGVDCLVKVDILADSASAGGNGTIMDVQDNGTVKIAGSFNKGVIVTETSLIATSVATGTTLKKYGESKHAQDAAVLLHTGS
jgi:hypothetical protein